MTTAEVAQNTEAASTVSRQIESGISNLVKLKQ